MWRTRLTCGSLDHITVTKNRAWQAISIARPFIRDELVRLARASRLSDPKLIGSDRLSIATFHRVLPEEYLQRYPLPQIAVTPDQLGYFLRYFVDNYTCLPLCEAFDRWQTRAHSEKPLLAVTFDDGALDNFEWALPVLDHFGVRASFYIPVDAMDQRRPPWPDRAAFALKRLFESSDGERQVLQALEPELLEPSTLSIQSVLAVLKLVPEAHRLRLVEHLEKASGLAEIPDWANMMSVDQLRDLCVQGHEIGSHSASHPLLPLCDDAALVQETAGSGKRLEEIVDRPIVSFCYPDGAWDLRTAKAVEAAGYRCAVTTDFGSNQRDVSRYALRRCDMDFNHSVDRHGAFSKARVAFRMSGLQRGLK